MVGLLLAMLAGGSIQAVETTCGLAPHAGVCIGAIDVPSQFRSKFQQGAEESIAAVFSDRFEPALASFILRHAGVASIADPWRERDASGIVSAERAHYTTSIRIVTKSGLSAWWARTFSHNVAYEGVERPDGGRDIPVNLFAMGEATAGSIANTIAHEVAHAAGLRHPDSNRNLTRAFCEPPYVIGTIIRQIADGDAWTWDGSFDCPCFKPNANQDACVP